jgi:hypothetical protein
VRRKETTASPFLFFCEKPPITFQVMTNKSFSLINFKNRMNTVHFLGHK